MRFIGRSAIAVVIAAVVFGGLVAPGTAGAATATVPKHTKTRYYYPTVQEAAAMRAAHQSTGTSPATAAAAATPQSLLTYHGGSQGIGVTIGQPRVYLVVWGSQWGTANPAGSLNLSNDAPGVASRLWSLFNGIGSNNERWSTVMTQYCEGVAKGSTSCPATVPHVPYPSPGVLAGVFVDNASPAPASASKSQISAEAVRAAEVFGNTTAASNRNAQYVVASATGTHPDGWNPASSAGITFCAWHDSTSSSFGSIAYTNLPYLPDAGGSCGANTINPGAAGTIDGVSLVEGHEYAETLTDQTGNAWRDANGEEDADKCAWMGLANVSLSNGSFPMQPTWSNQDNDCVGTPLSCEGTTAVMVNGNLTLTGRGGDGILTWSAPGGTPPSLSTNLTNQFTTHWASAGTKTVTLTSGNQTARCTVTVISETGFQSNGGGVAGKPAIVKTAATDKDYHVFARGTNGHLMHEWVVNGVGQPNASGFPWEDLGGFITNDPIAVSWGGSRVDVFATAHVVTPQAITENLVHYYYDTSWHIQSSVLTGALGVPAAVWDGTTNHLMVFFRTTSGTLTALNFNGTSVTSTDNLGATVSDPSAISVSTGRVDVFWRNDTTHNGLMHARYGSGVRQVLDFAPGVANVGGRPAVAKWFSYIAIAWRANDSNGTLYTDALSVNGNSWFGAVNFGGILTSDPTMAAERSDTLDIYVKGSGNGIWHRAWRNNGWTDWMPLSGPAMSFGPVAFAPSPNRVDVMAVSGSTDYLDVTRDA